MQIQAINNQNFGATIAFEEHGNNRRANIDAGYALTDNDLKAYSYSLACLQTDENKHCKINNAALLSLPFVAAIRDTVLTRGNNAPLLKSVIVSSPAARALTGAKTFGKWMGVLAIASGVAVGFNKLEEKFEKFRKFSSEQPFTSMAAAIGTTIAATYGAGKGIEKVSEKLVEGNELKVWRKIARAASVFNDNKVVKNVAKTYINMSDKIHPAIKSVGIVGLAFAPLAIATASVVHSLNHRSVRNQQAMQNYAEFKLVQANLQARQRELDGFVS